MNPKIKQVIESCLQKDPEQRATPKQLLVSIKIEREKD